jgi:hypothetical protein
MVKTWLNHGQNMVNTWSKHGEITCFLMLKPSIQGEILKMKKNDPSAAPHVAPSPRDSAALFPPALHASDASPVFLGWLATQVQKER